MKRIKEYFIKFTRPIRWKIIKVLSPGIWSKFGVANPINAFPRGSTNYAIDYFGDRSIIYCEVGVYKGGNVLDVIKRMNIRHSYLIDMYEEYETIYDGETIYFSQKIQDEAFEIAKEILKPFEITWILKYSDKAIEDLPDDIDFIYIDGNHEFEFVKKDIEFYWEKVSKGGILAGHDFYGSHNGVINAVFEFAMENKLHIYSNLYDWWFVKSN